MRVYWATPRHCRAALCGGGGGLTKRQTQNLLLAREDTTNLVCSMYSAIRFGPNSVFQNSFYHFMDLKSIFWPIWVQTAYMYVHNKMC